MASGGSSCGRSGECLAQADRRARNQAVKVAGGIMSRIVDCIAAIDRNTECLNRLAAALANNSAVQLPPVEAKIGQGTGPDVEWVSSQVGAGDMPDATGMRAGRGPGRRAGSRAESKRNGGSRNNRASKAAMAARRRHASRADASL